MVARGKKSEGEHRQLRLEDRKGEGVQGPPAKDFSVRGIRIDQKKKKGLREGRRKKEPYDWK